MIDKVTLQAIKSYAVSALLSLWSVVFIAVQIGYTLHLCDSFTSTLHYLGSVWWNIALAVLFGIGPFYRAGQGAKAAKTIVTTPPDPTLKTLPGP